MHLLKREEWLFFLFIFFKWHFHQYAVEHPLELRQHLQSVKGTMKTCEPPSLPLSNTFREAILFPLYDVKHHLAQRGWQEIRFILFRRRRKAKNRKKKGKKKKPQLRPVRKCLRLWSYFWIHQVSKLERKINKSWHTVSLALHSNQNFCLFWDVWCFSSHLSGFYQPFFIYFFNTHLYAHSESTSVCLGNCWDVLLPANGCCRRCCRRCSCSSSAESRLSEC